MKAARVLVVDDDEVIRELTVAILRRCGHEPRGVSSGRCALEALEAGPFDLVVSDVMMPEMTGVELFHDLRAKWPELPVVLMTGGSQNPERTTNAVRLGAAGLLYKPFSHEELATAVAKALGSG